VAVDLVGVLTGFQEETRRSPRLSANSRDSEFVVGAIAPYLKPVPQRVGAKGQSDWCGRLVSFWVKDNRLDVRYPG
jgi:hypothetical protein